MRGEGLEGKELKDAGDALGHSILMQLLTTYRPDDAILSEEGVRPTRPACRTAVSGSSTCSTGPASTPSRRATTGRSTWRCGRTETWWPAPSRSRACPRPSAPRTRPRCRSWTSQKPRIAVSRTRPPAFVEALAEQIDAELVPMGSAGAKVISVVRDVTDVYVHAGGQYEWDSAAPVVVARAAGLDTSRADRAPLQYNQGRRAAAGPARLPPRARRDDPRRSSANTGRSNGPVLTIPEGCTTWST